MKTHFFHPITRKKLNSDSKIRKLHGHFCKKKKNKMRDKWLGYEIKAHKNMHKGAIKEPYPSPLRWIPRFVAWCTT